MTAPLQPGDVPDELAHLLTRHELIERLGEQIFNFADRAEWREVLLVRCEELAQDVVATLLALGWRRPEGHTAPPSSDVPDELLEVALAGYMRWVRERPDRYSPPAHTDAAAVILAAVLPAHEAMIRAKVAEELLADAASHRRTAERRATNPEILKRAQTLEAAARRITRRLIAPAGPPRDPHATGLITEDEAGGA